MNALQGSTISQDIRRGEVRKKHYPTGDEKSQTPKDLLK
jgi:hypothetical protein